jgi:hypothetical protein
MSGRQPKNEPPEFAEPAPMSRLSTVCLCCVTEGVPRRSLLVALVVGTILNLINQGDALLAGGRVDVVKLLLTYAVPYCVATYGAVSFRLARARASGLLRDDGGRPRAG